MKYIILWIGLILLPINCSLAYSQDTDFAYEELIVNLTVNYQKSERLSIVIKTQDQKLLIPLKDLEDLRVKEEYLLANKVTIHGTDYVLLEGLKPDKYNLDTSKLALDIQLPVKTIYKQYLSAYNYYRDESLYDRPISGAYINYDFNLINSRDTRLLSGFQKIHYFTENNGNFAGDIFSQKGISDKKDDKVIRLDTSWTMDNINDTARWRIGDSLTKNADWSSSTRFAGIQYATNFDIDPNLVTYPLIDFAGSTVLPSSIEVYSQARSFYRGEIKSGDFQIGNIPIPTGAGDFTIETKDIGGNIQTITLPYYVSPIILKEGLSDYSFAAGIQRQNYANASNEYNNLILNSNYMKGLNNFWTSGIHYELMNGKHRGTRSSLGLTNKIKLNNYGVLSTSVATNLHNTKQSQKTILDYSYNNSYFNFGTRYTLPGKKYEDIYIDRTLNNRSEPTFFATAGIHSEKYGYFSLDYLETSNESEKLKLVSFDYSRKVLKNSTIHLNIGTNLADKSDNYIALSYRMNFNNTTNVEIETSKRDKLITHGISASSNNREKEINYQGSFTTSDQDNSYNVSVRKHMDKAHVSLHALGRKNYQTQRINLSGGLVYIDNDFFITKPINSSIAIVKVGEYKNIPVFYNNQFKANTNESGKVLIPNVISYSTSKVSIDHTKLPLNAYLPTNKSIIAPPANSGVIVDFKVQRQKPVMATLVDETKNYLKENHTILIKGLNQAIYSGYYGHIYIENIDTPNLEGTACIEDKCCGFDVPINYKDEDITDIGIVTCKPIKKQK